MSDPNTAKLRGKIPYGYICYTGKVLTDNQVDSYNRINAEIDCWIKDTRPVPEFLLNHAHRTFQMYALGLDEANR